MDLTKKNLKARLKLLRKERKTTEKWTEKHTGDIPAQICHLVEKESALAYIDGQIDLLRNLLDFPKDD